MEITGGGLMNCDLNKGATSFSVNLGSDEDTANGNTITNPLNKLMNDGACKPSGFL